MWYHNVGALVGAPEIISLLTVPQQPRKPLPSSLFNPREVSNSPPAATPLTPPQQNQRYPVKPLSTTVHSPTSAPNHLFPTTIQLQKWTSSQLSASLFLLSMSICLFVLLIHAPSQQTVCYQLWLALMALNKIDTWLQPIQKKRKVFKHQGQLNQPTFFFLLQKYNRTKYIYKQFSRLLHMSVYINEAWWERSGGMLLV